VDPILSSLLLDLTGLSDEEAEKVTYQEYVKLYMDRETHGGMRGERITHDGASVTFYADRFWHAFFTTHDKAQHPYDKTKLDRTRAARVRWIENVIGGKIPGTSCWFLPALPGGVAKRLYVLWNECYLIWLNAANRGGWKFSSAYTADRGYIRRKIKNAHSEWRKT